MKKYHATSHIDANPFHSKHNKGYNLPKNSGWVRANKSTYGMKVYTTTTHSLTHQRTRLA